MKKKVKNNLRKPFVPESFSDLLFFQFITIKEATVFSTKNKLPCMICLKNLPSDVKIFIHQKNIIYA